MTLRISLLLFSFCTFIYAELKPHVKIFHIPGKTYAVYEISCDRHTANMESYIHKNSQLLYIVESSLTSNTFYGLINTVTVKEVEKLSDKFTQAISNDSKAYEAAFSAWKRSLRNRLYLNSTKSSELDLEYLLSIRFLEEVLPPGKTTWRENEFTNFFHRIAGIQDIRYALPLQKNIDLRKTAQDQLPPKELVLPQVEVKPTKTLPSDYPMALHVPQNCYYLEFPDIKSMLSSLKYANKNFQQWSGGLYPKNLEKVILDKMKELEIPLDKMLMNPEKYGRIVVAGWDPYFQSGTSLLFLIEKGDLTFSHQNFYKAENTYVLSNGKNLLFSSKQIVKGKTLADDPHFRHARERISHSEKERFYLFLSDYWFTHFLSPKWQIMGSRLAECDARIRMAELLRRITQKEYALNKTPNIKDLRNLYHDNEILIWILRDLEIKNDRPVHKIYGGLHSHKAIDELQFDRVSELELEQYNKFKRAYERNWQRMDPLAFQINKEQDHYLSRLYISPISQLSDYRDLHDLSGKDKKKHRLRKIPSSPMGISVQMDDKVAKALESFIKSPIKRAFASIRICDFDVASFLKENKKVSVFKFPALFEIPKNTEGIAKAILAVFYSRNITAKKLEQDGETDLLYSDEELISPFLRQKPEFFESGRPSDIYFYLDVKKAEQIVRYSKNQLVLNRLHDNWLVKNRRQKLEDFVRIKEPSNFFTKENDLQVAHINPYEFQTFSPVTLEKLSDKLPELINSLKKVEIYISLDPNSILFESKIWQK